MVYKESEYTYDFRNFWTIITFGRDIYDGTNTLKEANDYQTDLLAEVINFKEKAKPKSLQKNEEKKLFLKTYRKKEKVLNAFTSKIFLIKSQVQVF